MSTRKVMRVVLASLVGPWLVFVGMAAADPAFHHDFQGPGPSWQRLDVGIPGSILAQECVPSCPRGVGHSERIVGVAPVGESLLLACPTARIAVIPESQIRLWVKSERPAIQLAAQVVLPRTLDPKMQAPRSVIVRGAFYNRPGQWQQLVLSELPKLLAAQVRLLRTMPGTTIDPREAFIDAVVLLVPGDPQGVEVFTHELQVDGILLGKQYPVQQTNHTSANPASLASVPSDVPTIRLQSGLLYVEDRPFVPRAIEWRGEPFAFLADRGFNAICLPQPPNDVQAAEAQRLGLWFISSAPRPESLVRDGIGQVGDRVVAWRLEDEAIESDSKYAARWAELVRQHDAVNGRPTIVLPEIDWPSTAKSADVILARHPRLLQVDSADFGSWLGKRMHFVRPGTPLWATIATQYGQAVQKQVTTLADANRPPPAVDPYQMESLVKAAVIRGIRGFVFQSTSPLSATDAATRGRALDLERINRQLQLVEPWLAAGQVVGQASSTDANWTGIVLHVERARLVIPVRTPQSDNTSANPTEKATLALSSANAEISFQVPGVPESSQAFALTPVAMRTLPLQRVAGGTRIVLRSVSDELGLLTEDPQVIHALRQRVQRDGPRYARLHRDAVGQRAAIAAEVTHRLGQSELNSQTGIAAAESSLRQADSFLASGRLQEAFDATNAAAGVIVQFTEQQRRLHVPPAALQSNPLALSFEQLAEYAALERRCAALSVGDNLLFAGDFEDLGQMTHFGWRHFQQPVPGFEPQSELSANQPRSGRYCLALRVTATEASRTAASIAQPPAWVVSPPLPVDKGQIIEITGWVRVEMPSNSADDGFQILDSLGGPELSIVIHQTSGWQPFRMIRAADEPAELRLTFALAGAGTASIDAVMVRALQQPIARRLPPVMTSQSR